METLRFKVTMNVQCNKCRASSVMWAAQVTVGELIDEVQAQQKLLPKPRAVPKYDTVQRGAHQVPGKDLRPGAPKMQLRPHEEAQLPLVGHVNKAIRTDSAASESQAGAGKGTQAWVTE